MIPRERRKLEESLRKIGGNINLDCSGIPCEICPFHIPHIRSFFGNTILENVGANIVDGRACYFGTDEDSEIEKGKKMISEYFLMFSKNKVNASISIFKDEICIAE